MSFHTLEIIEPVRLKSQPLNMIKFTIPLVFAIVAVIHPSIGYFGENDLPAVALACLESHMIWYPKLAEAGAECRAEFGVDPDKKRYNACMDDWSKSPSGSGLEAGRDICDTAEMTLPPQLRAELGRLLEAFENTQELKVIRD